jgi:hypothetical protein
MTVTITAQRILGAQELSRLAAADDGTYVFPARAGGVVTASSGMTLDVSAIASGTVVINGTLVATGYTASTVVLDAADATHPRRDYIFFKSDGTVGIKKGTAAAKPALPTLADSEIAIAEVYVAANDVSIGSSEITDRRSHAKSSVEEAFIDFVEGGRHKGFFALGAPRAIAYTDGLWVGMGFTVELSGTSGAVSGGAQVPGAWHFNTGATSGEFGMVVGPFLAASQDWTLVWRGSVPSAASQTWFFGAKTSDSVTDENGIIAFRISDTGNIIGVCDSGGTETTRDSGATGATECTLRIEVRAGGTIVRFFRNNVQIGADVTTNIPTGSLFAVNGIRNSTTAEKVAYTYDLFGWREA